jgi:hypothetical protein
MVYGPFDARDARAVEVRFWLWRQIEPTYDKVWFAFSNDGGTFYGWWWDGTAGWEEKRFDLTSYLAGDASVWVGWMFESDGSVQYEGPWVDDILIRKYVPGTVTVRGSFFYADRSNNPAPASFTKVYLYDQDPGGSDDLLDTTVTDANGFFQFSARANWDEDDPDPNPENRRLDLYVVWETDVNDSASARRRVTNLGGWAYRWPSEVRANVQDGAVDFLNYCCRRRTASCRPYGSSRICAGLGNIFVTAPALILVPSPPNGKAAAIAIPRGLSAPHSFTRE